MKEAEFKSPTRIYFGPDAVHRIGKIVRDLGGKRVLLVSDQGLIAAGHVAKATDLLRKSELDVFLFHDFQENPTSEMAERGMIFARTQGIDFIVGLGGGSSMDCAKAINFLLTNGGAMSDYWGQGKAKKPLLPMVGVPTTAGTGSETQSIALITNPNSHRKMACGDPKASFKAAILDPKLTLSQPAGLTATTGFDAIGHAVESYVCTSRTPQSQFFSLEAWRLLEKNYPRVIREPGSLKARGDMLLGSAMAGIAIENSMLGATHALANPLTERFGTAHGVAIALLLHHVVRWNTPAVGDLYNDLAVSSRSSDRGPLSDYLQGLLTQSGLPTRLREVDIPESALPELAAASLQQWTATFNPRKLTEAAAVELYGAAY